jgi:hypothetical protein
MDRAYEGDDTRLWALDLGYVPVVPPKSNRLHPWDYDRVMYFKRNEVERLFRRLKGFPRVFSRFDKLDVMFTGFIHFALIVEALRMCQQALIWSACRWSPPPQLRSARPGDIAGAVVQPFCGSPCLVFEY